MFMLNKISESESESESEVEHYYESIMFVAITSTLNCSYSFNYMHFFL